MWNNKKFWGKNNLKYDEGFVGNFVLSVILVWLRLWLILRIGSGNTQISPD